MYIYGAEVTETRVKKVVFPAESVEQAIDIVARMKDKEFSVNEPVSASADIFALMPMDDEDDED